MMLLILNLFINSELMLRNAATDIKPLYKLCIFIRKERVLKLLI